MSVAEMLNSLAQEVAEALEIPAPKVRVGKVSESAYRAWHIDDHCSHGELLADDTIVIEPGDDPYDLALVVIHEITHLAVPCERPEGCLVYRSHTEDFFLTAATLYTAYAIPEEYALRRCQRYEPQCVPTITACYETLTEMGLFGCKTQQ